PASDLAIALINRVVADLFGPRTLARLEWRDGVPEDLRTVIVVPTLLTSRDAINGTSGRLGPNSLATIIAALRFARGGRQWHRRPEQSSWPGPRRRRAFLAFSPQAHLERTRTEMDGMGTQAGKAARAKPAAARFHADKFHTRRGPCPRIHSRRALCNHARCGYAAFSWHRGASGRHDGAPVEQAAIQRGTGARGGRLRRSAAPCNAVASHRSRRLAVPADFFRSKRHRSLRFSGVRRLSGSFSRRLLHREGNLRSRCV